MNRKENFSFFGNMDLCHIKNTIKVKTLVKPELFTSLKLYGRGAERVKALHSHTKFDVTYPTGRYTVIGDPTSLREIQLSFGRKSNKIQ